MQIGYLAKCKYKQSFENIQFNSLLHSMNILSIFHLRFALIESPTVLEHILPMTFQIFLFLFFKMLTIPFKTAGHVAVSVFPQLSLPLSFICFAVGVTACLFGDRSDIINITLQLSLHHLFYGFHDTNNKMVICYEVVNTVKSCYCQNCLNHVASVQL